MIFYFEGVDGVGKTTIMQGVARELIKREMKEFVLTKEPGGPAALKLEAAWKGADDLLPYFGECYETGMLVRELCVNHPEIPQLSKRALYRADSLCNWERVSCPAIGEGKAVLSDRGWISDLVYGSVLLNTNAHSMYQFNTALTPSLPSVTYVMCLTASSEVREKRLAGNVVDAMDKLGPGVRNKLDSAYRTIIPYYLPEEQYGFFDTDLPSIPEIVGSVADFIMSVMM